MMKEHVTFASRYEPKATIGDDFLNCTLRHRNNSS
jgi:hypothetical protein